MTRGHLIIPILLSLFGGGCALDPIQPGSPSPTTGGDIQKQLKQLRSKARLLRYNGRYTESIEQLDQAIAISPKDADLIEERIQTRLSWSRLQLELQDRSRLIQAQANLDRLPLLERLAQADPADRSLQAELQTLRKNLPVDAMELSECGRRQKDGHPDLALGCLRLAVAIDEKPEDRSLLALLVKKRRSTVPRPIARDTSKVEEPAPPKRTAEPIPEPETESEPEPTELLKARSLMDQGKYFGAIRQLRKLQDGGRGTADSRDLLEQAQRQLTANTRALLETGDRLYRQGRVKDAMALWETALSLDPYNEEARTKSARAARVLSNLQALDANTTP